uniref:Zinc finger protein n=1 Tax=Rhipicephalus appendiculatus TaxID=34631 RepID=A0A131YUN9_RHIAP
MHRTKCAAVIKNVLAPHFKRKLDKMVKEAPGYSLMLDESTDVSATKHLCVSVRFLNPETNCISDTFLDLKEVANGTAEVMHHCVMNILSDHGLALRDSVGIATDGANSMCGQHNSLWSRLRDGNPDLILIKCVCHSLDLVAAKTMETMPSALEYMVHESHNYFAPSTVRLAAYKELYNSMLEDHDSDKLEPPKLPSPSPTRWLAVYDCIERIVSQFESLQKFFQSTDSRDYKARVLRDMYNDIRNYLYLIFLAAVLHNVKRVNMLFQSQTVDPLKLFQELENLYVEVLKCILKPAVLRHNSSGDLLSLNLKNMEGIYLDSEQADLGAAFAERLEASGLPVQEQACIREQCFNFLQKMAMQLQTRIPNATSALRRLQAISPEAVLGPNACRDIFSLPSCFFGISRNQLEAEVRLLRSAFATTETHSATSFWYEALAFRDAAGI